MAVFDLTDRQRTERALRETESSYASLFQSVSDAIYIQDGEGRFLDVNDGAVRMYGHPRERFIGATPEFLSAPGKNNLVEVGQAVAHALAGVPQQFEFWGLRANSEVFPKEVRLFPSTFRGQKVVIALAQDITERKRAEAELRLLREAIEQAGEAIVITDPEANIHYANPAFETVTGYSREEAVGENTRLLNSGQQSPEFYRELWNTIISGRTWHGSLINRRKDGSLYSEEQSISPVLDEEGRIINYVAVKRDVSERLLLEDQLVQAQKMESIGRLAGGVAHDFNNMLGIVLGYAELAKRKIEPDSPAQEALSQILLAAERSSALVRQLLTFARRQPVEPQVLDLNELLGRTGTMLRGLLTEEIELVLDLGADLWSVRADPSQIDQILANLIVNARDAIAGSGRITVATRNRAPREAQLHQVRRRGQRECPAERHRHWGGHGPRHAREALRAVLHHQGGRQGNRARARHRLRHRAAEPRPDRCREHPGSRRELPDPSSPMRSRDHRFPRRAPGRFGGQG